jgi:hypothetical protein
MPLALAVEKLNRGLTAEAIRERLAENPEALERLRSPDDVFSLAQELGGLDEAEIGYLADIPMPLVHGIRAAVAEAASQGQSVHFQYSPGYDFSVQMWDYGAALSVHVTGPYPPDYPRNKYQQPNT